MKQDFEHLGWYSRAYPVLMETERYVDDPSVLGPLDVTIFDCRALPVAFVEDTGDAVWSEYKKNEQVPRLPDNRCFFEFADQTGVLATICEISRAPLNDDETQEQRDARLFGDYAEYVETTYFVSWRGHSLNQYKWAALDYSPGYVEPEPWGDTDEEETTSVFVDLATTNELHSRESYSRMRYEEDPSIGGYMYPMPTGDALWWDEAYKGTRMLFGVLTLMQERLVLDTIRPDPAPKLSAARARRGRNPISGESHVLRVNVPAIRAAARHNQLTKHESPLLHWRRGHWRVLRRFSEVEKRVWVRRCLVGDPSKGFVRHTDYRLVSHQPMIEQEQEETYADRKNVGVS